MNKLIHPIINHFQFTDFILNLALADLKDSDAKRRIRNGQGASISWIVGHLLAYRFRVLAALGHPQENDYEEKYGVKSADSGEDYPPINILLQEWNTLTQQYYALLETISDDLLLSPSAKNRNLHGEQTRLDEIAFFPWHESSHLGAIGLMRLEMGYPAISELVMKQMQVGRE